MATFKGNSTTPDNLNAFVRFLKKEETDFEIQSTGYSKAIKWENDKFLFMPDGGGGRSVFPCYMKIKSDVLKSQIHIDEVPRYDISYFGINDFFRNDDYNSKLTGNVVNVDISSAYLTVLRNVGMVTQPTYDYVQAKHKLTRLKAVGMLATQKTVFTYEKGRFKVAELKKDDRLRNVFFYCCYRVGEVMNQIAAEVGNDFLFFWVDGIYLREGADHARVENILREGGFLSKTQMLHDCEFKSEGPRIAFQCTDDENKTKSFLVPVEDNDNKLAMKRFLSTLGA